MENILKSKLIPCLKNILSRDFIEFLLLNFLFMDTFLVSIVLIGVSIQFIFVIYEELALEQVMAWRVCSSLDSTLIIAIILSKIVIPILYYKTDYQRTTNPLITNFITWLQSNVRHRVFFLILIFFPYVCLSIYNSLGYTYDLLRLLGELVVNLLIFFFASGVISYLSLFGYWKLCEISKKRSILNFLSTNLVVLFSFTFSLLFAFLSVIKYVLTVGSFVGCWLYVLPMFLILLVLFALFWVLKNGKNFLVRLLYFISGLIVSYQAFLCALLFAVSPTLDSVNTHLLNSAIVDLIKFWSLLIKVALLAVL